MFKILRERFEWLDMTENEESIMIINGRMKSHWLFMILALLQFTTSLSCLARRQEHQDVKKKKPIIDLVDEKDDGQTLTLGDSENMIVPPEEDEDQTDDQAQDIDKNEDLEDLGRVQVVHLDNEAYELDIPNVIFNQSSDQYSMVLIPIIDYRHRAHNPQSDRKNDQSIDEFVKPTASKNPRSTSKIPGPKDEFLPHLPEKTGLRLKSGVVRPSTLKESKGFESQTANQMIIVVVIVLTFLICLLTIICIVFLIKTRLITGAKTCNYGKTSKTSLLEDVPRMV